MANISKNDRLNWENNLYIYEAALETLKAKIRIANIEYMMLSKTEGNNKIEKFSDRIKSIDSIKGKLEKNGLEFTEENIIQHIHDIVGCRIVCLTLTDLYAFRDILNKIIGKSEGFNIDGYKDYIENPKPSGYQSYHMRVSVPVIFSEERFNIPSEIQIRTTAMDAWATLEHKLGYKPSEQIEAGEELLRMQFDAYAKMVETMDHSVATVVASQRQKIKK